MTAYLPTNVPSRQIRAAFDDETVTVYQAFSSTIANAAVASGRFVPPFSLQRMTWIKPSFIWMIHRSGWASKPGQEHVLAIRITRVGFEWALWHSCLTYFDSRIYSNRADWTNQARTSPVRIQWDPERSVSLSPLPWRTAQIGLSMKAIHLYTTEWITEIVDISPHIHGIHRLANDTRRAELSIIIRQERPYPLSEGLKQIIGAE